MPSTPLQLSVAEFKDADHWRWVLSDSNGAFLDDHSVVLDRNDACYPGFLDLDNYVYQHADREKWPDDEVRVLDEVGAWIGTQVLGGIGDAIVKCGTPITVRVILSAEAEGLLYRPLEMAHINGKPLAQQDISLVFETESPPQSVRHEPIGNELRMLAVFSLPTDASSLSLRRERYALKRAIDTIAKTHQKAIALTVLQYGVTREALKATLEDGDGWDVLHFSGHGLAAALVLEKADGTADKITSAELTELIAPARGRLKLVTLSACSSGAETIAETAAWLGLPEPRREQESESTSSNASAVARALMDSLDCAVLAMRYPVGDDFAIALSAELYAQMLGNGQALTRAVQRAMTSSLSSGYHPGTPPLSVATPALFGRRAVDLQLQPPPSSPTFEIPPTGLAYFPDEPERFVGRVGQMAQASAAIAPRSEKTSVLFYGMAGAGKTACALELTYRYPDGNRFSGFVWHKAPDEGDDISTALANLALDLEKQLPGFAMVHLVDRADELNDFLPQLTGFLAQHAILIVIDNLESLLTDGGVWRDARWERVIDAMVSHRGLSRLILTSRRLPQSLAAHAQVVPFPIHALSRDEALLLARELPHFSALLRGQAGLGLRAGRELVRRTLEVVQGHPKLIDLADKQAASPDALANTLDAMADESAHLPLGAFFADGQSAFDADAFLTVLSGWTKQLVLTLDTSAKTLFFFLCAMEADDRQSGVVEANWGGLWKRLGLAGDVPELAGAMGRLESLGLVAVVQKENGSLYTLHPGVAEAGRKIGGDGVREAVDAELAAFWYQVCGHGIETEMEGGGGMIVQAGLSGAPYLLRQGDFQRASILLEQVIARDASPQTIARVLPRLRRIATETHGTVEGLENRGVLSKALLAAGHLAEAEAIERDRIPKAEAAGQFRTASAAIGRLINLLMDTGRSTEGLDWVERKKEATRRGGFGRWTQLGNECQRLQLENALGRYAQVLAVVEPLRVEMVTLPVESAAEEIANTWNVREGILDTGHTAALSLGQWETCLALNAEIIEVEQARGASTLEITQRRFNDQGPLIRLGRYSEATVMLDGCRRVFEAENAIPELGAVYGALADLADERGHYDQAIRYESTAFRYHYRVGNPDSCAISHNNLSNYIKRAGEAATVYLAHCLAAGIIDVQTQDGFLQSTLGNLAIVWRECAPHRPPFPASFDALCDIVEQTEGVRFRELFDQLPKRFETGDAAMAAVIAAAEEMAKNQS